MTYKKSILSFRGLEIIHSPLCVIDRINDASSRDEQPIELYCNINYILVQGWAVDPKAMDIAKEVYVCMDNKTYQALHEVDRMDVAESLCNSSCRYSGFKCFIPIKRNRAGEHTLYVQAITKDGKRCYQSRETLSFRMIRKNTPRCLWWCDELFCMITRPNLLIQRLIRLAFRIKKHGFKDIIAGNKKRVSSHKINNNEIYSTWIQKNEATAEELREQKKIHLKQVPKMSIITLALSTTERRLIDSVESIISQTYPYWELGIIARSEDTSTREILKRYSKKDNRIKSVLLADNKSLPACLNQASALTTGEFIGILYQDDLLPPFALFEVVKAINDNPNADFIYSDEDEISEDGKSRSNPFFKSDFAPDTLRSYNYMSRFAVFKRETGQSAGWFREGFEGQEDYDFVLRISENTKQLVHIPKILYHRRISGNSVAGRSENKTSSARAGERCLSEHLKRTGLEGNVKYNTLLKHYRVCYDISKQPMVSIIIPNKDQVKTLGKCVTSIIKKSSYKNYEILIVENSSENERTYKTYQRLKRYNNLRVIEWNHFFNFSRLNNDAVKHVKGEMLLFLNNDTEVINTDWLERMLEHAMRKEVGAVGAKLYYPDGHIQHAGVAFGLGEVAGYPHHNFPGKHTGYFNKLTIIQNVSVVTAACLMMRRDVFDEINGFNESLSIAFNDVDLCLKISKKGYWIVWTPYAELYHYESKSRGYENTPEKLSRYEKEVALMQSIWKNELKKRDPYFNSNLTLHEQDHSPL